jgi:hypothetical protein
MYGKVQANKLNGVHREMHQDKHLHQSNPFQGQAFHAPSSLELCMELYTDIWLLYVCATVVIKVQSTAEINTKKLVARSLCSYIVRVTVVSVGQLDDEVTLPAGA